MLEGSDARNLRQTERGFFLPVLKMLPGFKIGKFNQKLRGFIAAGALRTFGGR